MCVDDERANLVVTKHNLGKRFKVYLATSGKKALEILSREFIAVLLTDQRMPGMSGVDLAEQVYRRHPDVIRVIITAYADQEATVDAINRGHVTRFIKKPWTKPELEAVVIECIQNYQNSLALKNMQQRLVNLDRITSLGIMASSIAHDLRQPLSYIEPNLMFLENELEHIRQLLPPDKANVIIGRMEQYLNDATLGAQKLRTFSSSLLTTLSGNSMTRSQVQIRNLLNSVLSITRSTITRKARLKLELPDEDITIYGSEGRLNQLLINLLLNAAQAIETDPAFENLVILRIFPSEMSLIIEVEDTGKGIAEADMDKIFTPMFSTKGDAGSGMGLAICKQIVSEHDGSIEVFSTPGNGTRFKVTLPLPP